jgi:hypothetical protein
MTLIVINLHCRPPYRPDLIREETGLGQVQQKAGTGNAVVKPGKLYAVKFQVYRHLRVLARCRRVERWSAGVILCLDK